MNCAAAVDWLYGTQLHGIRLGLEPVWRLLKALDVDPARTRFIHVAGTNGKGSVCAMLDAITRAAGIRTGLFTSPHLVRFSERIRLNGQEISEEAVAAGLTRIRDLIARWEHSPTFFEITTALALAWFQEQQANLVILETGLGGRLDATNVVTPLVSVLTPIDFDHQQWLGPTLADIAREKAGIIKAGVPVVSAPQPGEAAAVFREVAAAQSAPLRWVDAPLEGVPVGLAGRHQRWNAALAVAALEAARLEAPPAAIASGLASVQWPGRFQRLGERLILDGAHNPASARQLVETWSDQFRGQKATLILGVLQDKDVRSLCSALLPLAARVLCVPVQSPRTTAPEDLARLIGTLSPIECATAPSVAAALEAAAAHPEPALVAGSLFLVGEALSFCQHQPPPKPTAQ